MEDDSLAPFQGPDSILSDTVERDLAHYMDSHENHKPALDLLMDNYEGFPDMIRALVDWASIYTDGEKNLEQAVEAVLLEHEPTIIPKLDDVLTSTKRSLPVISEITASDRWNPVVSAMAARNKESTLHNLLTRETRLSKAGITQDVLSSPKTFVQTICQQISDVLGDGKPVSETDLLELYKRVATMSTYDECTTITALRVLNLLARETQDPMTRALYRRISQEVRKEAINVMVSTSIVPEHVARQYVIRLVILTDCVAANVSMRPQVVDALLGLLRGEKTVKRRYEAETLALRNVYGALIGDLDSVDEDEVVETVAEFDCSVEEKVVLIKALCHYEVFDDALKLLFSHEHRTYLEGKPDEGKRKCLSMLLAYAGVFIAVDELDLPEMLSNDHEKERLRGEVKQLWGQIETAAVVCEDLKPGCPRFKIKGKPVETLLDAVKHPLLAHGVLMWAREGLQGGSDLRALMVTAPRHLAFLEAVAQHHEILRGQVLETIRKAFMREYPGLDINQQEELRGKFMKSITGMVRIQMGPQIVDMFLKNYVDELRVDKSHLRNFVSGLLETISPPYSPQFAEDVLKLLSNERVASAVDKDVKVNRLVRTFREQVSEVIVV